MSARNRSANAIVRTSASGGEASVAAMRDSYTSFGQRAGMPTSPSGTPAASPRERTPPRPRLRANELPPHPMHAHAAVVLGYRGEQGDGLLGQRVQRER